MDVGKSHNVLTLKLSNKLSTAATQLPCQIMFSGDL